MEEISSNNQNGVETTEIPGEQVNLSKKTLALLNAEQNPSENDDIPAWQKNTMSLFYSIVGEEPPNNVTRSRSRRTKVPTRPSEAQLSAPYIEEQRPENPDYIMRISEQVFDDSPEAPEANEANGIEPISPTTSTRRRNLRTKFLNAAKLTTANIRFAKGDGRQLQDVGDGDSFTWLTSVPFLWLKRDPKGRKSPPVIINMLKLAITDSESDPQYNWQSIFRIELAYGDVKWVVKRTSFDFITLHVNLTRRPELSRLVPKFPSGLSSWFKTKIFHSRQDDLSHAAALERRKELEKYLINVITRLWLNLHISYELYAFLELSAISITSDMGWKGKEGYMEHKVERYKHPVCSFRLTNEKWEHRWIIVRDSYIAFCSHISSTTPADVFLIDRHFECDKVEPKGLSQMLQFHAHIELKNSSRRIEIKTDSHTSKTFMESIDIIKKASPWVKQHRHDSFAPIRENARVKWYVDGKDYFFAVSQAILAAKSEIYIEDWWLSPELYLRRPPSKNEEFRLDRLLKKKAEEGVMIYIIVYKEVTVALTLDSHHTKFYLQGLHKNIKVQRHPDHGIEGVMFWAHHEKMVVVDSRIAFIGGLDLCFGRYDTHSHELSDWPPNSDGPTIWPGQDYSNPRIKDFQNVKEYDNEIVDKSRYPRMPWHDVSIGMVGQPARDVARHFVQRWNFIKEEKSFERETLPFLLPKGEYVNTRDESKFKGNCEVQLLRSSAVWSSGIKVESSIYSAYHHLIRNAKHFIYIENQFFVTSTEDDPNYTVKNRIGKSIVERVIKAHQDGEKFRVIVVMPLLPGFEADLNSNDAGTIRMVMHWQYVSICRGGKSVLDKIKQAGIDPENYISFFALRGYDKIKRKEYNRSASNDYIKNKQSETSEKSQPSHNHDISTDSYSDEQTKTSLRGIGGEPGMPAGMTDSDPKHTYVTEEIYIHSKLMIVDDRYVIIGSANINDRSQLGDRDSEIAILVEDKQTVPSRMNGNKYEASKFAYTLRSNLFKEFLGLIKPQDHATVTKSSLAPVQPDILKELLHNRDNSSTSILDEIMINSEHPTKEDLVVMDPLSDEFFKYWQTTAKNNTDIYRSIFKCIPDDNVTNWKQYEEFVPNPAAVDKGHVAINYNVKTKLEHIRGHLVTFPLHFLESENLMKSVMLGSVTPNEIFT
ncbi:phospholipase D/nuclease [Gigaspora margarita]|uniref:Phospholipase n=2 Tax=Gigaspora margarita TaxID=4874 RepID=A0A8H4ACU7_GIGMA|nr:phospholipase D/nuclease [Gigaspora margarita]